MLVCLPSSSSLLLKNVHHLLTQIGSGCIAALEAEKYLSELEDAEDPAEGVDAKKGVNPVL